MATELRDSLVKIYLQMPYKNSLQLSPALQKLQQQFNANSLVKYTWSAISAIAERNSVEVAQNDEVVLEKKKEEKLIPKWKLNKSVVSKVKSRFSQCCLFVLTFIAVGLHFIKNAPFDFSDKIIRNGTVKHFWR